jgi:hypothetical protein
VVGIRRREPQLLEDVLQVLLDGALRDHERVRDRRIGASFRHQPKHLALARAEIGEPFLPTCAREEL